MVDIRVLTLKVRDMLGDGRLIKRRIRDGRGMCHTHFVFNVFSVST